MNFLETLSVCNEKCTSNFALINHKIQMKHSQKTIEAAILQIDL